MHHVEQRRLPANVFVTSMWAFVLAAFASVHPVRAQSITALTNLSQLRQALTHDSQVVAGIQLEGTVFACNTNTGVLVLQDASGTELLEMDRLAHEFQAGDQIRIDLSPCLIQPGEVGIYVSAAPVVNNDGLHSARSTGGTHFFEAGRHPFRLDWFNQFSAFELSVSCVQTNSGEATEVPAEGTTLLHAVHAECFQGCWSRMPNYQLLRPVKVGTVTNFDVGFRTDDILVGIRFEGYFDAPRTGEYFFSLRSDDGSRLWVGSPEVPVRKIGANPPPPAPPAIMGEPMTSLNEHRLATLEGRVQFVSRSGKGLQFELHSEQNSLSVVLADAGILEPADLLNASVRVSGVAEGMLTENQRVVLGRLAVASSRELTVLEVPRSKGTTPPVLTTVIQVHSLSRDAAALQLPVTIRGVVTAIGLRLDYWMAIQDATRGTFVRLNLLTNCFPEVGEVWRITGHTEPGDFAPIIVAEKATLLGKGRLPQPAHPSWNQLANGSMDVQWVELLGVATSIESNRLSLLLPEGHQEITMPQWTESGLKAFHQAVVRIRGTLFAEWNAVTHEVRSGNITLRNASIAVEEPAPDDPFDAPEKTPRGLFYFDARATPFQRVKVLGQVTYADAKRVFIERGSGVQVLPAASAKLHVGDWIEAVG